MKRISSWAAANQCAVVLIENLNKKKRKNDLYRSFGSIEVMVIARSVICVDRSKLEPQVRYLRHITSNLTEESKERIFKLDDKGRVDWLPSNEGNPMENPDNYECNSEHEEV